MDGCLKSEYSLGAGPIPISLLPKQDLDPNLRYRFLAAQAAAKKEGVSLEITSGYRTLSRQKYLFAQAIKKYGSYEKAARWVAPAEVSHHPLGLAIDVNYPKDQTSAKWLEINGYKFGLCRTFKNEWWHFEPNIAPGWKCPKMLKDARALLNT
jgi:LAS superfamily LD-carboxypeptidase LdcB